jgi:hypothetical protein
MRDVLCADDGVIGFADHDGNERGIRLLHSHCLHFGLQAHAGKLLENGDGKASKPLSMFIPDSFACCFVLIILRSAAAE